MAGKKTIAYPIELKFVTRTPYFFNGAKVKYHLHKDEIDNILHFFNLTYNYSIIQQNKKYVNTFLQLLSFSNSNQGIYH